MSFGNESAIREDLLTRVVPYIEKHRSTITVIGYDIQLQTWVQPTATGNTMINTYCLILLSTGGLVGEEHHCTFVYTFGNEPKPPNDRDLEEAVKHSIGRLGIMRLRQIQQGANDNRAN